MSGRIHADSSLRLSRLRELNDQIRQMNDTELAETEVALRKIGALQNTAAAGEARRDAIRDAITKLDPKLGLSWTPGPKLRETINFLMWRFCGVPDTPRNHGGIQPKSFGTPIGRWSRGNLSVLVNPAGCRLRPADVTAAIMGAFNQYQAAQPFFRFRQVSQGADIVVRFGGSNLDPALSQTGALGTGGPPPTGRLNLLADVGLPLKPDGSPPFMWTQATLASIAIHEVGHVLGLSHSTNAGAVMYPFAPNLAALDAETIQAIQSLYGWAPQRPLTDRASTHRPSLTVTTAINFTSRFDVRAYMAWKGAQGDSGIYWAESADGIAWGPQRRVPGVGTSIGPSIATYTKPGGTFEQGLMMAWKGVQGDSGIYWAASSDLQSFGPQARVGNVGTSDRPALCEFGGQMVLAWKGVQGDSGIYWSRLDGSNWRPQKHIEGRGTSHGPALVVHGGKLHMFWKGIEGDSGVYHAELVDPANGIWGPQDRVFFVRSGNLDAGQTPIAIGTSDSPVAVSRDGELFLAWKGIDGDTALWFSRRNANGEYSGQISIPNVGSAIGPGIASFNGRIILAWRGLGDDRVLYTSNLG